MTTTLEVFAKAKNRNYCTLPTIDVKILPDVHHCKECGVTIKWEIRAIDAWDGRWVHAYGDPAGHSVSPKTRCRYCHSEDAVFRQHAWFDAVECARCGGVDGYAIGD